MAGQKQGLASIVSSWGRFGRPLRSDRGAYEQLRRQHEAALDRLQVLEAAMQERVQAEAASEAKSRFLATVSHEIRIPLSGVLGVADLLASTPLTREQQSYVSAVKDSGEALMGLVDGILDFARIEAGHLDLVPEPFDPVALVESVVELLAPRAHGKGLDLASYVGADVPSRLVGDPHRLRQVLLNLAGNAVKFTEVGGIGVAVGRCRDGQVLFTVSDTGPGVSPDKRAVIFEEYGQADRSGARQQGGTGLGLAIVQRIVSEMGGGLAVGERVGGGALFAVRVALPAATDSSCLGRAAPIGMLSGHRALIVSPETFQPAYLAGLLKDQGGTVVRVGSPVAAVALLQRPGEAFDSIFVDCAGGDEEARALAAVARLVGVRKTVLLFSPFERRRLGQAVAAGFDAWLVKPIRRASLAARFTAPFKPAEAQGRAPGREAPRKDWVRVLLAEDDPVNALIARTSLERLGAEVTHVTDGQAAEQVIGSTLGGENRPFDLALMDVSMPVLDGLEATRRIRAAERGRSETPLLIVGTTAHALADARPACELAGMDDVLSKPIDQAQLMRLMTRAVAPAAAAS